MLVSISSLAQSAETNNTMTTKQPKVQNRPTWLRDIEGKVYAFPSVLAAARFIGKPSQSVQYACNHGGIIVNTWQATQVENDFSKCRPFGKPAYGYHTPHATENEIKERIKSMKEEKQHTDEQPVKKIKEPKTAEDWEAMRQRAMQPFVCSLTDEDIRLHEEEVRKESVKLMKRKAGNNGLWSGLPVAHLPLKYDNQ